MVKRTRGGRYPRYYKRSNFKKITSNYVSAKFDVSKRLLLSAEFFRFDDTGTAQNFTDLLTSAPDFQMYRQLYLSYKLQGFKLEVTPMLTSSDFVTNGSYTIGLLSDNDGVTFANITEADKSIQLNFNQIQKRYWSFKSGATGWIGVEESNLLPGKIGVGATNNATSGQAYWSVKFTFYILFKNKN